MPIPQEISQDQCATLQDTLNTEHNLILPKAWFIDKAVLIDALGLDPADLANFSGIRIYPGAKMEPAINSVVNTVTLITVAVDNNGADVLGAVPSNQPNGALRYDFAKPCPTFCDVNGGDLMTRGMVLNITK